MTVKQVVKFRDQIAKGIYPMRVICDNEHTFYENCKGYFPVMWDDENEEFTVYTVNYDRYSAAKYPFLLTTTAYEHIQFIEVALDVKGSMDSMSNFNLSDEDTNTCIDLFRSGAMSHDIKAAAELPKSAPNFNKSM